MKNEGFTLIEVIIYIALFSVLMGGAFVTAYQLIDGTNKTKVNTTVEEEGNFVMRKMDWMLTGLDSSNPPTVSGSGCNQNLTVQKINFPKNPISIRLSGSDLEISEAGGAYVAITTVNVNVSCLHTRIIPPSGSGPSGVSATTTINGVDFAITKYFRK